MNVRLNNISIKCMLAILLVGLFASCKDEMEEEGDRPSRLDVLGLKFTAFEEGFEKPTTRSIVNSVDDIDYVGVLAMKKKDSESVWSQVFDNDTLVITNERKEIWYYPDNKKKKWEPEYNYKFRGFYPIKGNFNESAGESCENGFEYAGFSIGQTELRLNNYKMATDPRDNSDLLVSQIVERGKRETDVVAMNMKHILACVNFNFRGPEGKEVHVTDFSIAGYSDKGSCTYEDKAEWDVESIVASENSNLTYNVEYTGSGQINGQQIYEPYKLLGLPDGMVFRDKDTKEIISAYDMFDDSGLRYLRDNSHGKYKKFYIDFGQTASLISNQTSMSIQSCQDLLFIPQPLIAYQERSKSIRINVKRLDWNGSYNFNDNNILVKSGMYAQIKYYFDNETSEIKTAIIADLTGNGTITEWEAGKKYNYTVGLYEYQATANITIEDWMHHTFEEELK